MPDSFQNHASSLESPASNAFPITPDNSTPLEETTRALYVGGGGDLTVTMKSGQDVLFSAVPTGILLPIRVSHVKASGTTATLLTGLV